MSTSIIGGMFGLEGRDGLVSRPRVAPAFLAAPHVKLASARCAFALLHRLHAPGTVWFPAYLCDVVLDAFPASTRVRFFPVTTGLELAELDWLDDVAAGDLVCFITYFGFDTWSDVGMQARARGAWVIEDACQALLNSGYSDAAHYVVVSPRKFVGVPDGGVLLAQQGSPLPEDTDLPDPPSDWWLEMLRASRLRAEYDRCGGDREWYEIFCRTEPVAPVEPTRMSSLTRLLLERSIDYAAIAAARRRNYAYLAEALPGLAMFPELHADVVPLGFPIRLEKRNAVRNHLIKSGIFPPVHWPVAGAVPPEFAMSHELEARIMTLPCDQRYGEADMRRMVECLREATEGERCSAKA